MCTEIILYTPEWLKLKRMIKPNASDIRKNRNFHPLLVRTESVTDTFK